jgi:hypothetical protein
MCSDPRFPGSKQLFRIRQGVRHGALGRACRRHHAGALFRGWSIVGIL